LVITGERLFHDLNVGRSDFDLRLVRPRKLQSFETIPDLVSLNFEDPINFRPLSSKKFVSLQSLSTELSLLPEM